MVNFNSVLIRHVFTMQPKYEFQPALDYVKLRRNHAEFSRSKQKLKYKHEKNI